MLKVEGFLNELSYSVNQKKNENLIIDVQATKEQKSKR